MKAHGDTRFIGTLAHLGTVYLNLLTKENTMTLQPIQRPISQPTQQQECGYISFAKPNCQAGGAQLSLQNWSQSPQATGMSSNVFGFINSMVSQMMGAFVTIIQQLVSALTGGQANGGHIQAAVGSTQATPSTTGQSEGQIISRSLWIQADVPSTSGEAGVSDTEKEGTSLKDTLFNSGTEILGNLFGGIKKFTSGLNLGGIGGFLMKGAKALFGKLF